MFNNPDKLDEYLSLTRKRNRSKGRSIKLKPLDHKPLRRQNLYSFKNSDLDAVQNMQKISMFGETPMSPTT